MPVNKVSAVLDQTIVDGMINNVDTEEAKLPFLINLTDKERDTQPRFGQDSIEFFNESLETVKQTLE